MNEKIFEEDLSISYLRAVAATGEIVFELRRSDVNSKDVNLSKLIFLNGVRFESELNVQLKATYSKSQYFENDTEITYYLKIKNYNDLRGDTTTPIILCLLVLPENKEDWVTQTTDDLVMKRCMYWVSLKGMPECENKTKCAIKIPKTNLVTSDSLNDLLIQIASNGGAL